MKTIKEIERVQEIQSVQAPNDKMYKELIHSIQDAVFFNLENADEVDVQRSSFTAGMVKAFAEVLQSMGHKVDVGSWNDNGCNRIGFIEIDGVVLVKNSKINFDGYSELLKK